MLKLLQLSTSSQLTYVNTCWTRLQWLNYFPELPLSCINFFAERSLPASTTHLRAWSLWKVMEFSVVFTNDLQERRERRACCNCSPFNPFFISQLLSAFHSRPLSRKRNLTSIHPRFSSWNLCTEYEHRAEQMDEIIHQFVHCMQTKSKLSFAVCTHRKATPSVASMFCTKCRTSLDHFATCIYRKILSGYTTPVVHYMQKKC